MNARCFQFAVLLTGSALLLSAQPPSFNEKLYPILEKAGCRNCHNGEGVASATRLHFPLPDASPEKIDAFGKSLVELVDRQDPAKSLLLLKPTLRIPHTGGERIRKGSAEETVLKTWIAYLAKLSGPELTAALRYRQAEAGGYGVAAKVVLRRLTQQPVQQHGSRPSEGHQRSRRTLSSRRLRQRLQESIRGAVGLSDSCGRLQPRRGTAGRERFPTGRLARPDSVQARFRGRCRPAAPSSSRLSAAALSAGLSKREEVALLTSHLQGREDVSGRRAGRHRDRCCSLPRFIFWLEETPNPKWKAYAKASRLSYFSGTPRPTTPCWTARRSGELNTAEGMERVARRMLEDPRARDGVDEFVSEWLRFDRVMTASRERRLYPLFSRELAKSMTEEARRFVGDLVWNDRNFMDAFTARLQLHQLGSGGRLQNAAAGARFRPRGVPAGIRARRTAGTGAVPDFVQQAGRHRADRPRAYCSRAVSVPAGAASAAGRGYQPAAGRGSEAGDQPRAPGDACQQPDVRQLPQPDRPDRLRLREVRCDRHAAREAEAAVLSEPDGRRGAARKAQRGRAGAGHQGLGGRACRIPNSPAPGSWASCWRRRRSVRSALSSRCSGTWPDGWILRRTGRC